MTPARARCTLIALAAAILGSVAATAQVSNLAADWVDGLNPNGVWSFRQSNVLLGSVANWTPLGSPVPQPAHANAPGGAGHIPAMFKLAANVGMDVVPGDILFHSFDAASGGSNGNGSIVWTAPASGTIQIAGHVWITRDIGRSLVWSLWLNGTQLTEGNVYSGDPYSRANPMAMLAGTGGASVLHGIAVNAGDEITFVNVTHPSSAFGDFTALNLSISYVGPIAVSVPTGLGCGGAYVPVLSSTAPVIGAPASLSVTGATPATTGALYYSSVPAGPLSIGAGCTVYLNLANATQLLLFTTGSGSWTLDFQVPFAPALAGTAVALQAVVIPTVAPLGFDLTNGVYALIGY
jgi:hypothetical protein